MDRGSWWATVHEVTKNQIQLTLPLFIPFRVAQDLLFYTKRPLKVRERKRKEGNKGTRYALFMTILIIFKVEAI